MAKRSLLGLTLGFFSLAVVMGFAIGCFTVLYAVSAMYEPKPGSSPSASLTPGSAQVPSEALRELRNQQQSTLNAIERLQRQIQAGVRQASPAGPVTPESTGPPALVMMAVFALGIVAGAAASFVGFVLWFRGRAPPDYRAPALDVTGGRRGGHPETVAAFQPAYRAEATRADDESARVTQTDSAANVAGVGEPRQVLLEEIERLESRIGKLEESRDSASRATPYHMPPRPANPVLSRPLPAPVAPEPHVGRLSLGRAKRVTLLLANTETLLKAGRPKEALASAEEVLALEPTSIDAVVKRGKALEDLGRPEEAITAYDRAIQIDAGSTIAYLRKGELFNKLERYNEALECYEKALGTQQQNGGR